MVLPPIPLLSASLPSLLCSIICENVHTTVGRTTAECVRTSVPSADPQSDCVVQRLWIQSEIFLKKCSWIITSGENQSPGHWCRCCQICYSMLPPLGKLGHCTATSASAKPTMIKNVVITNGQLPSVLGRDEGAPDQHQLRENVILALWELVVMFRFSTLSWGTISGSKVLPGASLAMTDRK